LKRHSKNFLEFHALFFTFLSNHDSLDAAEDEKACDEMDRYWKEFTEKEIQVSNKLLIYLKRIHHNKNLMNY